MLKKKISNKAWGAALTALSLWVLCGFSYAAIVVKKATGEDKPLTSILISDVVCVSLSELFQTMGYKSLEDSLSGKLTCSKAGRKVVFSEELPFFYSNDTVRQMPCGTILREGSLFLPAWVCAAVLGEIDHESVSWNQDDSCFTLRDDPSQRRPGQAVTKKSKQNEFDCQGPPSNAQQVIKTIVLDPGHGGKDPGAIGPSGIEEKNIVLSVALRLREALKKKSV